MAGVKVPAKRLALIVCWLSRPHDSVQRHRLCKKQLCATIVDELTHSSVLLED